ncbi:NUDIX hydrolase [Serinibacter salmoneus]|uniref:Isopentenyldiphosphate isomerase n=1 Tax=Serinibacter salmoneus TaxID=556530 RepID=A0A2A9D2A2_9MICO|nr:NUDIX hydrolase [Serinibacter salmoneus]PFG20848.1 isopentenyldiphosphate isomerase [Serinibacter salmoneus]
MAEWWDLRDPDGEPIGQRYQRGSAAPLPEGAFHLVSSVCAVRADGRVLITRRAPGKTYPGEWEFPAGSAVSGEESRSAAVRELHEESGLAVAEADLVLVARFVHGSEIFDLYAVSIPGDPVLALDPEEVDDAAWVTLYGLAARAAGVGGAGAPQMCGPWVRRLREQWQALSSAVAAVQASS